MKRTFFISLFFLGFLLSARTVFAASEIDEGFARPTFRELAQTVVLLGGYDITNNRVADDYIQLIYPELYKKYYSNDVAWNEIRQKIVTRILERKEYYRVLYETSTSFNLGRYDFETQSFPLIAKMDLKHVGSIILFSRNEFYTTRGGSIPKTNFPKDYTMLTGRPLRVDRLDIPMSKVEKIMTRIEEEGNTNREIYGRIRVRLTGVGELISAGGRKRKTNIESAEMKGDIVSIDFFIDKDMSKPLGSIKVKKD